MDKISIKSLAEIADNLDKSGLVTEADALDDIIREAGPIDWLKNKLMPKYDKDRGTKPEESAPPDVPGVTLDGKVYKTKAELDAVDGNSKFVLIDQLLDALAATGKVAKQVIDSLKAKAASDLNTWANATQAAASAGVVA